MAMSKDEIFKQEIKAATDFKFEGKVATVFDDMVNRSVPFYEEIQRMISEIAKDHVLNGTSVYDLGCSTGTTIIGDQANQLVKNIYEKMFL
jgi:tRNA (cmo5U34)-methyltransferase